MERIFDTLIGARLESFSRQGFSVITSNGEKRSFRFEEDEGDCCGYNELKTKLFISDSEMKDRPAITNIDYENYNDFDGDNVIITFFGLDKTLAEINSLSSSGSGWCYGACVNVVCNETNEIIPLSEW